MRYGKSFNIEKIFNTLAVLVVFLVSFLIPVFVSLFIMEDARNARIKMDMSSLKNWAQVYQMEEGDYRGLEMSRELNVFFEDIKSMKGEVKVFVGQNYESYCTRVIFKKGSLCVDNSGQMGKDKGICSSSVTRCD